MGWWSASVRGRGSESRGLGSRSVCTQGCLHPGRSAFRFAVCIQMGDLHPGGLYPGILHPEGGGLYPWRRVGKTPLILWDMVNGINFSHILNIKFEKLVSDQNR